MSESAIAVALFLGVLDRQTPSWAKHLMCILGGMFLALALR